MTEHHDAFRAATPRERELELEVARLQAELETLRGGDGVTAATRFLAMAAATADMAVAEARREADEIVEEVSAQAEVRRDEATRVAAEAEALAARTLAEVEHSQASIEQAKTEAASIRETAEIEAQAIITVERGRLADELCALADVRAVLESERTVLESYHEELRRRVQELAASMVSFMSTQPPLGSSFEIDSFLPPQLAAVLAEIPEFDDAGSDITEADGVEGSPEVENDEHAAAALFEAAILAAAQVVDVPDEAVDEMPKGPMMGFGGVPVFDEPSEGADQDGEDTEGRPTSSGLFARAREFMTGFEDLAEDDDEDASLFATLAPRLSAQTPLGDLADGLDTNEGDDVAFQQFLDGDDAPDPSRDWLLRPEQS